MMTNPQPSNKSAILIIARPGWFRDSLNILVTSIAGGNSVCLANDVQSVSNEFPNYPPVIAILALESMEEMQGAIEVIKKTWLQTGTILLVDNEGEIQAGLSAGADMALLKGTLAARLLHTVENLLSDCRGV